MPELGQRTVYHDAKTTGLQIRVTSTGVKTFSLFRRIKGGLPERMTLGRFPDMTIEQARKLAARVNSEIEEGSNPAEVKRSLKGEPTVSEFFKEYGERHGQKKKSWSDDQQRFRDYLKKPLGTKKLSAVTREMVGRILSDMDSDGKAGATVNNVRALTSGIFGKAIEWNYLTENPVRGIKTRKSNKRDRFLQSNELPRFFASLGEETNVTVRDFFLLSLLTGARRSNVLEMRWSQINLADGIWRIPDTKNGTPQNVTLSPEAALILTTRKEIIEGPFVFPGNGKSGHLIEPKNGWQRIFDRDELSQLAMRIETTGNKNYKAEGESLSDALDRARHAAKHLKIDTDGCRMIDLRIHDLRRTLGSWQAKQGASLSIIGKSLNHKNQQTTAIYARLDLDPVRASVNSATTAMFEAAGIKKPVIYAEQKLSKPCIT
ncbi:putative prophage CPS-53 integrase [mine drainage metagenome]|uniref:Putative prophage CPS-53 integrase n=1 Tax=mine drainage metagenome TaxID=410659 RepID=A0A1J5REJ9_9ZZZZ